MCTYTHTHTNTHNTHARTHTCTHTYAYAHTHTYAHKYIHTQTKMGSRNMYYPSHASSKNTLGTFHSSRHRSAPLFVTRARVLFTQVSPGCGDAEVTHRHPCNHSCERTSLRTCRHITGRPWSHSTSTLEALTQPHGLRQPLPRPPGGAGPGPPLRGHTQQ